MSTHHRRHVEAVNRVWRTVQNVNNNDIEFCSEGGRMCLSLAFVLYYFNTAAHNSIDLIIELFPVLFI